MRENILAKITKPDKQHQRLLKSEFDDKAHKLRRASKISDEINKKVEERRQLYQIQYATDYYGPTKSTGMIRKN